MASSDPAPAGHGKPALVAVGTSAGGLRALRTLLGGLSPRFRLPVVVVQHLAQGHESHLAEILDRECPLPVTQAVDGEIAEGGHVYLAPPGCHLRVEGGGRLALDRGEKRSFTRPSVDVLFESAARAFDGRVVAVVLTGGGSDGAEGARAVKAAGGRVVVQLRQEAQAEGMPAAAMRTGVADLELSLREISDYLDALDTEAKAT